MGAWTELLTKNLLVGSKVKNRASAVIKIVLGLCMQWASGLFVVTVCIFCVMSFYH